MSDLQYQNQKDQQPVQFSEEDFSGPLQLKSTLIHSHQSRISHNSRTSFYQSQKLTEYFDPGVGKIIPLITLDHNQSFTVFHEEAVHCLELYSDSDITFMGFLGPLKSGKSFVLDKILNLADVDANHFCTETKCPGLYIWSLPCRKNGLRIFLLQLAGCGVQDYIFNELWPLLMLLSSGLIFVNGMESDPQQELSKLNQMVMGLDSSWQEVLPMFCLNLHRKKIQKCHSFMEKGIQIIHSYLPNAKKSSFRGRDQELSMHSFLNRKCIQEQYIQKVSQVFKEALQLIGGKRHHSLVFNGRIFTKYISLIVITTKKKGAFDLGRIYEQVIGQLYLTAYNYCVLSYHEALQKALDDEKAKPIELLLKIFGETSQEVISKYDQFNLEQNLYQSYRQKLFQHINSKEALILQINNKKALLQIRKLFPQQNEKISIREIWKQVLSKSKDLECYGDGSARGFSWLLSRIITQLSTTFSNDFVVRQIETLKNTKIQKKQELERLRGQKQKFTSQKQSKEQEKKKLTNELSKISLRVDELTRLVRQLRQKGQQTVQSLQKQKFNQEKKLERLTVNLETLRKEIDQENKQKKFQYVQKDKKVIKLRQSIDTLLNKQKLVENTLEQLQTVQKQDKNKKKQK